MVRVTHFQRRPHRGAHSIERVYEDIRGVIAPDCEVTVWTCRHFSTGAWPRLVDMWLARRHQGDVNHVTGDVHYLTFLLDSRRTVLTVHDLVTLERTRGLKHWLLWFVWYWLAVRRSRAIVTISEKIRADLLASTGCAPDKVRVIHNAVSDEFKPTPQSFDDACPRILQIGTSPNKNVERLAEALAGIPCRLVIVGTLSGAQIVALSRHGISYENHVGLSRSALVAQYADADLLTFVSTYEGFGMPVMEAQAVGRPVVTSSIAPMPEVAGDAACLVDPFDVASIRSGVLHVVGDADYRRQLVEAGFRNVERFSLRVAAEKYASLYRDMAGA